MSQEFVDPASDQNKYQVQDGSRDEAYLKTLASLMQNKDAFSRARVLR